MKLLQLYTLLTCLILGAGQVLGQISVHPVKKDSSSPKIKSNNIREAADSPLSLPFWDDFSFTDSHPTEDLWEDSSNVYVNFGLGLKPPSLGVASFDGLRDSGFPYQANTSSIGPTDALTSRSIDLSSLTVASNVYVSFFYQYSGNGEKPDDSDSLRLEFKNNSGEWISVWPAAQELNVTGEFVQVMKKVDDASFFHDHFQFKFQSFGRQSGPFDVWNIDYVYVNKGRSASDTEYPDRAISTPMTSPFGSYTSIPYDHFDIDNLSPITISFYNHLNRGQPYFSKIHSEILSYNDSLFSISSADTLEVTESSDNMAFKHNSIKTIDPFIYPFLQESNFISADSVQINLTYVMYANDNDPEEDYSPEIYAPIDFRSNDTTRSSYILSNYYAYDDGSAEFGAGYEATGGRLAYKFQMGKNTVDHIVAVDIYFPYINANPGGKSIDLMIMKDLKQNAGSLLYKQKTGIITSPAINSFIRYGFDNSVEVSDTFYIAYKQNSPELYVGLDKNTNAKSNIYYNIDGTWNKNILIEGSLMIRPVFGPVKYTTSTDPTRDEPAINVFPNPSGGLFQIKGQFDKVKIFDIRGMEQIVPLNLENGEANLNLSHQPDGLYILQFITGNRLETVKVVKNSF